MLPGYLSQDIHGQDIHRQDCGKTFEPICVNHLCVFVDEKAEEFHHQNDHKSST